LANVHKTILFGATSFKKVVVSSIQRLFRWPFQMSILDETLPKFIKRKHPRKGKKKKQRARTKV
jgi:hypothetical protein